MCDIRRVESVQWKFTKRLPGYRDLSYADRRKLLELDTFEQRRLKFDLVMCYIIVFGLVKLGFSEFFVTALVTITRGHPYRLFINFARYGVREDFFAKRVVIYWNYLPADFNFSSVNCFKRNLNKIDFTDFLIG